MRIAKVSPYARPREPLPRLAGRAVLGACVTLTVMAGCATLLGIEDVTERKGEGGGGGAASSAGPGHGGVGAPASSSSGSPARSSASAGSSAASTTTGSSTSSAASSSSGGSPMCMSCIASACAPALTACQNDPACASWYDCFETSGDSADATSCDQMQAGASSLYSAVYSCACTSCQSPCATIDPCSHPCKVGVIFANPMGTDTVYCPFAAVDGGPEVFCAHSTQHCCEPPTGTSTCEPATTACAAGDHDWHCTDGPTDCVGAAGVCCTNAGSPLGFAATPQCETQASTVTATYCQASCDATQNQLQVCTSNAECPAPQKCWPILVAGTRLAVCH